MTTDDPRLLTVLYTSRAQADFDESQLDDLLEQSRRANTRATITGMLLYREGRFIQVLEGPAPAVEDLLERIRVDPRHFDVRLILDERIDRRRFEEWSMGYERIEPTTGPPPEGYRDTFDDLDQSTDLTATARAARELSLWFQVRARRSGATAL